MKRYPLLLPVLLYAAGIIAAADIPIRFEWWLAFAVLCATASVFLARAREPLLFLVLPFTGASLLALHMQIVSPVDLRLIVGEEPRLAILKGILTETPSYTRYEQNGREHINTSARLRGTEMVLEAGRSQPIEGTVLVNVPGILPEDFFGGQPVTLEGVIGPPKGALAEGLFDYRKYLATQRVYFQLQTRKTNDWKLSEPVAIPSRPFADGFLRWGQKVTALGLPNEDEELHLLWAMSLGWRPGLNSDSSVPFIRTGTMHIFAISGLHVALIAAILVQLLRFIRIPRAGCALAIIPLIWFYTGATGWQPSAIRSTIMSSIVVLGWSLKRPSNLLNSLLASALIILVWQPEQLFQASFQLSFFVVLSMALLLPSKERADDSTQSPAESFSRLPWLPWFGAHPLTWRKPGWKPGPFLRWWRGDELLPPQLEPAWLRGHRRVSEFIALSLLTSGAAWIGSLPLIMYYFSIITPISLFANLLVVPLSSMALTCNLAALCTAEWFSHATTLFNHAGWFFMLCMDKLSSLFASWRWGYFYTRQPSTAAILCYYLFMVMAALGCLSRTRLRYVTVGALALGLAIYFLPVLQLRNSVQLTILPTGGTILINDRSLGKQSLVDTSDQRGAKMVVSPFLHAQGINSLDSLFLTHASIRHTGGASGLLTDTPSREAVTSKHRFRSRPYNAALRALETNHISHVTMGNNDIAGRWRILHPSNDSDLSSADDRPLVLKGEFGGLRMLLISELGAKGQDLLLAKHATDLRTDILIAGMPSRDEPLSAALLEAAAPRLIVLCTSDYPAAARGSRRLRERLQASGAPIFYSDEDKAITITIKPNQYRLKTMTGEIIQWHAGEMPKKTYPTGTNDPSTSPLGIEENPANDGSE